MKSSRLSQVSKFLSTLVYGTAVAAVTTLGLDIKPSQAFVPSGIPITCGGEQNRTLLVNNVATVIFQGSGAALRCDEALQNLTAARNSVSQTGAPLQPYAILRQEPDTGLWLVCAAPAPLTQTVGLCPVGGSFIFTLVNNSSCEQDAIDALEMLMFPIRNGRQSPNPLRD